MTAPYSMMHHNERQQATTEVLQGLKLCGDCGPRVNAALSSAAHRRARQAEKEHTEEVKAIAATRALATISDPQTLQRMRSALVQAGHINSRPVRLIDERLREISNAT